MKRILNEDYEGVTPSSVTLVEQEAVKRRTLSNASADTGNSAVAV